MNYMGNNVRYQMNELVRLTVSTTVITLRSCPRNDEDELEARSLSVSFKPYFQAIACTCTCVHVTVRCFNFHLASCLARQNGRQDRRRAALISSTNLQTLLVIKNSLQTFLDILSLLCRHFVFFLLLLLHLYIVRADESYRPAK